MTQLSEDSALTNTSDAFPRQHTSSEVQHLLKKYTRKKLQEHKQYIQGACAALTGEVNHNEPNTLEHAAWFLGYYANGGRI